MANCPKCVIDSGHLSATAVMLASEVETWDRTIADMMEHGTLSAEEHEAVIGLSQDWCDFAEAIEKFIEDAGYKLREIAKAHSTNKK